MFEIDLHNILTANGFIQTKSFSYFHKEKLIYCLIGTTSIDLIKSWTAYLWKRDNDGKNYYNEESILQYLNN